MVRTRATKGRPRLPSRKIIDRVATKRGSTVESLRASITSIKLGENEVEKTSTPQTNQQAPDAKVCLRDMGDEEENIVNIKQDEDGMAEVTKIAAQPKRRTQGSTTKASVTKKHKSSPPSSTIRTTRSKTLNSRIKPYSIHPSTGIDIDSESEHEFIPRHTTTKNAGTHPKSTGQDVNVKTASASSSLDLLRPYLAFQLSVSCLQGKAYKAAQASMASVLDVVERLEQEGGGTLTRAYNSLSSSSEEREMEMERGKGRARREKKVKNFERTTEEDVLPRKQRELNEQTRKRLEQERQGRRKQDHGRAT
ncbi:uncharacterized protein ALTATR162_LOCUS2244 [Alternaria atra]|uniref:Uncharacterized protein n=1 Tax=Alternaria atra TaxID=119953 RepID=A0A8J2HXP6_9PLEO|nr:uncharacterized protein ALTATR162_LOCUS2244 [Alternaria atra]CAG5148752.1 unnamed protein product [Alternaria atra]